MQKRQIAGPNISGRGGNEVALAAEGQSDIVRKTQRPELIV